MIYNATMHVSKKDADMIRCISTTRMSDWPKQKELEGFAKMTGEPGGVLWEARATFDNKAFIDFTMFVPVSGNEDSGEDSYDDEFDDECEYDNIDNMPAHGTAELYLEQEGGLSYLFHDEGDFDSVVDGALYALRSAATGDEYHVTFRVVDTREDALQLGALRSVQALPHNERACAAYEALAGLADIRCAGAQATEVQQPDVALMSVLGLLKEAAPIFEAVAYIMHGQKHGVTANKEAAGHLCAAKFLMDQLNLFGGGFFGGQDRIDHLVAIQDRVTASPSWSVKAAVLAHLGNASGGQDIMDGVSLSVNDLIVDLIQAEADKLRDKMDAAAEGDGTQQ